MTIMVPLRLTKRQKEVAQSLLDGALTVRDIRKSVSNYRTISMSIDLFIQHGLVRRVGGNIELEKKGKKEFPGLIKE